MNTAICMDCGKQKADLDYGQYLFYCGRERRIDMEGTAILSSYDHYTTFTYGEKTLTFRTCNGLERYTKVLKWDHGYLEVLAKYKQCKEEIEEYIDLIPILEGLYMDKESFLEPIKKVSIQYA